MKWWPVHTPFRAAALTACAVAATFAAQPIAGRSLLAQASATAAARVQPGEIRGRLTDATSSHAIGSGSITVRRSGARDFAGGALVQADGSFRVDGLAPGRYEVRVRAIGFAPVIRNEVVITADRPVVDLGAIPLSAVATTLDASKTVAERAEVEFAPGRTSYAVKNMLSASGGTAMDALRSIPLVEVEGTSGVTLRGNANVVVQINGRAVPLRADQLTGFLTSVPAARIKTIDVATSPSAKDDPEGTAGIINIVLNQDMQLGLSGGLTLGTGSTGLVSLGGNVGQERGKLTLFASGNLSRDDRPVAGSISRDYVELSTPAFTTAAIDGNMAPRSAGGTLRAQYRVTPRGTLSFDGYGFQRALESGLDAHYVNLDAQRAPAATYNQLAAQHVHSTMLNFALAFRQTTAQNRPRFSTELEYSMSRGPQDNDISGTIVAPGDSVVIETPAERDRNQSTLPFLSWKTDYTAVRGGMTLETGLKVTHRSWDNSFDAMYRTPPTGEYIVDPTRHTGFNYDEDLAAGYALLTRRTKKLQTQAGLRLENAATYLDVAPASQRYDRRYASAYPSAVATWSFTQFRSAQVSYSRRVTRPSPFQLRPTSYRTDAMHESSGNPDLRAEYTDAIEGSYQETRRWGTLQLVPYVRSTAHAMRSVGYVDSTGVTRSTFGNAASTLTAGTDLNLTARRGPMRLSGGGSFYHYASDASNLAVMVPAATDPSVHTWVWSARVNATWVFSPKADVQWMTNYRAPYATEAGTAIASVVMSGGARYKVWGDKGDISLRVTDPFGLQKYGQISTRGAIVESLWMRPGTRGVFLTISRNFGRALKLQDRQPDRDAVLVTPGA